MSSVLENSNVSLWGNNCYLVQSYMSGSHGFIQTDQHINIAICIAQILGVAIVIFGCGCDNTFTDIWLDTHSQNIGYTFHT